MRWGRDHTYLKEWRYWFAWHPVRLPNLQWVWLEPLAVRHHPVDAWKTIREYRLWVEHARNKLLDLKPSVTQAGTPANVASASNPLGTPATYVPWPQED